MGETLSPSIRAETSKSGLPTARYRGATLHSSYDPHKESETFAENVQEGDAVCLYGFGLGYHAETILKKVGPSGFLLVLELNPDILSAALHLRDLGDLLSNDRFRLVFGDDEAEVAAELSEKMELLIQRAGEKKVSIEFHAASYQFIPKRFERLTNALETLLMERRFPAVLGGLESENFSLNREIVRQSPGIRSLADKYKNQTAILCSAGPSLDDALPYLKQLSQETILTCVDTAYPVLCNEGIQPQFVFSLDPQDASFFHFVEHLENPAKLIYTATANARLLHSFQGEKFVAVKESSSHSDKELIKEKGGTKSGGSVSCLGLDCLIQMGCNPILLAGQDCAFSGGMLYSRGVSANDTLLDRTGPQTFHQLQREHALQRKILSTDCGDGKKAFTNQMMHSYQKNLDEIAQFNPNVSIFTLSSHGAALNHVRPLGGISELARVTANQHATGSRKGSRGND